MHDDGASDDDDDENRGEDGAKKTFVMIMNGFISIRRAFKTVCLISLELLFVSRRLGSEALRAAAVIYMP